jgi:hypothetical protein
MSAAKFDFVIAGAGVAALASARYIARAAPTARIALVSPHAPMSLTSSLSTECFRDHWPSSSMRAFMARSIALIEEQAAGGAFRVTPFGYLYCSSRPGAAAAFAAEAAACHGAAGARELRTAAAAAAAGCAPFSAASPRARGADVYATPAAALAAFPYLSPGTAAAMHARNAGWVSAHTMGMDMLDQLLARRAPGGGAPLTTLLRGSVTGAELGPGGGAVRSVAVQPLAAGAAPLRLECGAFVNATGPYLAATQRALLAGVPGGAGAAALPVRNEVHSKVVFRDVLGVIPRDAPQVILTDAVAPMWGPGELEFVAETEGKEVAERAAAVMPGGAHFRPYGGEDSNAVLLLWEAWHHGVAPEEPPPDSAERYLDARMYPEVALRGLARLVPGLAAYFEEDARAALLAKRGGGGAAPALRPPATDGGYYTKTEENHPLIGPAPAPGGGAVRGAFVCGALSGYGVMASHAAGELCAAHATGASALPDYAAIMSPLRYQDEAFTRKGGLRDQLLAAGGGQL